MASQAKATKFPCPCCGHLVFGEQPGSYDICPVCFWEDDNVQLRWPDWSGGANRPSLIESQRAYREIGAMEYRFTGHPLYAAMRQLSLATYGPPAIVAEEFASIEGAETVLLFGSWAARYLGEPGRGPNDIDVLVIGSADRDDVDDAAERAERRIGLPVQATVRTRRQWEAQTDSFIKELRSRSVVVVLEPERDAR